MSLEDGDGYISPFNTSCRLMSDAWKSTLTSAALACLAPLTVVLNLVVVVSISHFRHLQTTTNLILLSMAVSDLLVGLAMMPLMIVTLDSCQCISSFICFLSHLLSFVLTSASIGNMVLISVDRYVAICYPLRYSSIKPSTVKICVSVCWISSIIYNLILLKDNLLNIDFSSSCNKKCPLFINYILYIADIIITFYGPLTVIIVLYTRVFVVAVTQARAMRHFQTNTNIILLSMAVSDLLVGLAVMPLMIVTLDSCRFVLTSASVGNMVLISGDRYVAICYPLRYSSIKPSFNSWFKTCEFNEIRVESC
eukprot:XP_011617835.1 PREDICTED: trace amine-associated receptor 13c-like [Takifugu rubripes]